MAKVELKQPVVAEIAGLIGEAKAAVLVDYRGLTVEQDTELRKQLREAGVTYKVCGDGRKAGRPYGVSRIGHRRFGSGPCSV